MYPALVDIEKRHGPTPIHLQVYDGVYILVVHPSDIHWQPDTAHVLPVLFGFTTPGKFCYRAIANFIRHVTGMPNPNQPKPQVLVTSSSHFALTSPQGEEPPACSSELQTSGELAESDLTPPTKVDQHDSLTSDILDPKIPTSDSTADTRPGFFRIRSLRAYRSSTITKAKKPSSPPESLGSGGSSRWQTVAGSSQHDPRFAGEAIVYSVSEVRILGRPLFTVCM